jgi:hypothetical protein
MFGSENRQVTRLTIDVDPAGDAKLFHLLKAPGAITVRNAYMVSLVTQGAGTAVSLSLLNYGTAGTALESGGTIVAALGGTAVSDQLTALTPRTGTVSATEKYVDDGEWLVVRYNEPAVGWVSGDRFEYVVEWVNGKG